MKSTDVIQPQAMASIFAEDIYSASGTTNFEIPAATSSTPSDTCVLDDGFLPITSEQLPPDGNGKAPARKNFNGLFYLSTDQRVFLQNGGLITYDATVATQIGGYPAGAILNYIDSNGRLGFVKSLIDDNINNFVTTPSYIDGTNWELIEIANVQPQLAQKADVDLANVNATGTSRSVGWAMPSSTYDDLTLGASGATYTAPANGYYWIEKTSSGNAQYVDFIVKDSNNTSKFTLSIFYNDGGTIKRILAPVLKNDKLTVSYTAGGATGAFRFIYAVGSESEAS